MKSFQLHFPMMFNLHLPLALFFKSEAVMIRSCSWTLNKIKRTGMVIAWGPACVLTGPAIIEEIDSTTVIHPGYSAQVDRFGNLILNRI